MKLKVFPQAIFWAMKVLPYVYVSSISLASKNGNFETGMAFSMRRCDVFFFHPALFEKKTLVFPGEFKSSRLRLKETKQKVLISDTWCGKMILADFCDFFNVFFHVDERYDLFIKRKNNLWI